MAAKPVSKPVANKSSVLNSIMNNFMRNIQKVIPPAPAPRPQMIITAPKSPPPPSTGMTPQQAFLAHLKSAPPTAPRIIDRNAEAYNRQMAQIDSMKKQLYNSAANTYVRTTDKLAKLQTEPGFARFANAPLPRAPGASAGTGYGPTASAAAPDTTPYIPKPPTITPYQGMDQSQQYMSPRIVLPTLG